MTTYYSIVKTEAEGFTEPLTLADAKAWLKVDYSDDDNILSDMITAARQSIEAYTNLALVKSDVKIVADPDVKGNVKLPYANWIGEVVVNDVDEELILEEDYKLRGNYLTVGPTAYYNGPYATSYTIDPVVPQALKQAILMEVAQRYAKRGENEQGSGLSTAAMAAADPHKLIWL